MVFYRSLSTLKQGGFDSRKDALLEIAVVILEMDFRGNIQIKESLSKNIEPFPGLNIDQAALEFTGIDLYDPNRMMEDEGEALRELFQPIRREVSDSGCNRAIMVAHNAHFDLGFVNAAIGRTRSSAALFIPFHVLIRQA